MCAVARESFVVVTFTAAVYAPCILLLKNIEVIGKEKDGTTEGHTHSLFMQNRKGDSKE